MKTMTVREIRHRWPAAEKAISEEGGVLVTRDGALVARLLPPETTSTPAPRPVDALENRRWQERLFGKGRVFNFQDDVARERGFALLIPT